MNISFFMTVFLPNLSQSRRTAPYRHFLEIPLLLKVTFFTHRCMERNVEKYTITSTDKLNPNGKYGFHRYF